MNDQAPTRDSPFDSAHGPVFDPECSDRRESIEGRLATCDSLETTATLQSPPGKGGIAVICLRGPRAAEVISQIFRPRSAHQRSGGGLLQLGRIVRDAEVIDEAVVHHGPSAVEINIHGGPAVARTVMELLAARGAKVAPARASAPESFDPAHPKWNNPAVGRRMLCALPLARSTLVAAALTQQWSAGISRLARETLDAELRLATPDSLLAAAAGLDAMQRMLNPAEVVLAGPPNVGKSTLCNALVGREVSIVHRTPGTTRDWVRQIALLDGVPIWLTDTAGIWKPPTNRDAADPDAEAVARARRRIEQADLVLLLDSGEGFAIPPWLGARRFLRVAAKCDACPPGRTRRERPDATVSAHTGEGLDALRRCIREALGLGRFDPTAAMAFTQRQADCLAQAADAISRADRDGATQALRALLEGR